MTRKGIEVKTSPMSFVAFSFAARNSFEIFVDPTDDPDIGRQLSFENCLSNFSSICLSSLSFFRCSHTISKPCSSNEPMQLNCPMKPVTLLSRHKLALHLSDILILL